MGLDQVRKEISSAKPTSTTKKAFNTAREKAKSFFSTAITNAKTKIGDKIAQEKAVYQARSTAYQKERIKQAKKQGVLKARGVNVGKASGNIGDNYAFGGLGINIPETRTNKKESSSLSLNIPKDKKGKGWF